MNIALLTNSALAGETCATATPLVPLTTSVSIDTVATPADGPFCGVGSQASNANYFVFTPVDSGILTLDTCDTTFDTVLSIEVGACGSGTCVAANDDAGTSGTCANATYSEVAQVLTGGATYVVRVAGYSAASSGTGNLAVQWSPTCTIADADGDNVCEENDVCLGDDQTGDSDGDGVCDDLDICFGNDASGDTDSDLVCDDTDNCVSTSNPSQIDIDGDGFGNACDLCTGNDATGDTDGDGICDDLDPDGIDALVDQMVVWANQAYGANVVREGNSKARLRPSTWRVRVEALVNALEDGGCTTTGFVPLGAAGHYDATARVAEGEASSGPFQGNVLSGGRHQGTIQPGVVFGSAYSNRASAGHHVADLAPGDVIAGLYVRVSGARGVVWGVLATCDGGAHPADALQSWYPDSLAGWPR